MQEIPSMSDEFELTDKNLTMSFKFADDTTLISMIFEKLQLLATWRMEQMEDENKYWLKQSIGTIVSEC